MKKTFEFIGFILALIVIVAAVLTYLAPHFDWRVDAVLSGSMEPELKVGSLVVTRPLEPKDIEVGDIITFRLATVSTGIATHRVIGVFKNSPIQFQTKGDANDRPDPIMVSGNNLVGKICLHIPMMGYFTEFLKTRSGFIFGIVIPGLILISLYIISVWRELRENRRLRQGSAGK